MNTKKLLLLILIVVLMCTVLYYFYNKKIVTESQILPQHPGFPIQLAGHEQIEHTHYTLSYNEEYEQADWVMYRLPASFLTQNKFKRKDDFRVDSLVTTGSASLKDYKKSGYDRGHLCPAADMTWSVGALSETFFLSNMSPQKPRFNRGMWKKLEMQIRKWALENEELYVVTGPVFNEILDTIGENEVAVPRYYYKIVLDYLKPEFKTIGFVMENKKLSGAVFDYAVTVDSLEKLTNIDFFSQIPGNMEDLIESSFNVDLWNNYSKASNKETNKK
ncbi:DNA/RNA non-specific endonuclease [candidate division KSB1 bacterium]|nr:DNA/RNA non-specific endonuclease [candidate division KSB1 bacterium]MBL7094547.1 DNA/RNA non-specific endonuclease [candidate division KSB1 bacterium]